jgi:hypothetical protein
VIITPTINIKDAPKGWMYDPNYVYIGRAGKGHDGYYGNPFALKKGEPRGSTIERFREYAIERVRTDWQYASAIKDLRGKTLVCFCKPNACHGDVLGALASA